MTLGPLPDWYYLDNRFPTRARMDEAHAPIVSATVAALAGRGGDVIDLGCGNGALLGKIVDAEGAGVVRPFGVDLRGESIDHARRLLPSFQERFVTADLLEPEDWGPGDTRFALALLSPRRLAEADPVRAARLRAWLRERCDRLLVYAYGSGLAGPGGLPGFAASVDIELVEARPDVRTSLASRF